MARSRKSEGWVAKHDDQAIPESVQRQILESQMNADGLIICPDCANPIRPGQKKAFDHRIPLIDGGTHSQANLRCIHENPCHAIKTVQENKDRTKARSQFAAVHGIKVAKSKIPNRPFGGFASNSRDINADLMEGEQP
jgi:5-methylcytosine-specific restriction endonuclease McrA